MRVLIVDDHDGFRRFVRAFLTASGFDVVGESASGRAAVSDCELLRPDMVLLDIGLPDLDGIEVAQLLATSPRPPAVVLTSSRAAADYGNRLAAAPAAGFVAKGDLSRAALDAVLEGVR